MFSEEDSNVLPGRRIVIPQRNLSKSAPLGSNLLKKKQQHSSPLQSVENKLFNSIKDPEVPPNRAKGVPGLRQGLAHPPLPTAGEMANLNNVDVTAIEKNANIQREPFTDHYNVEADIGRGKFAVVKRCRRKHNGLQYAAKFLRKRRKGKDCRHEVLHEVHMLQTAQVHPRLVDLVEVFETNHEIIIVTEYAAGGELLQHIIMEERFMEADVVRLLRQVLEGLIFLHDRNIVHLDVKPQNILLTKLPPAGDIKLCDFGFARAVCSGEDVRDIIGTPDYVAPEVLSYEPLRTACDMWSVGVLAYVMLTGYSPFAGETKQEMYLNISQVDVDYPEDLFGDITPAAVDFISKLLVKDPAQRLTSRECLNHPWLHRDVLPSTPGRSPFGSPIGCRRALTPPSPDGGAEMEPSKKCRCEQQVDSVELSSDDSTLTSESEKENDSLENCRTCPVTKHVLLVKVTPAANCSLDGVDGQVVKCSLDGVDHQVLNCSLEALDGHSSATITTDMDNNLENLCNQDSVGLDNLENNNVIHNNSTVMRESFSTEPTLPNGPCS